MVGSGVTVMFVQRGHAVVRALGPVGHVVVLAPPAEAAALFGLQDGKSQGEEDDGADTQDDGPGQVLHHVRVQQVPQHLLLARLTRTLIVTGALEAVCRGGAAASQAGGMTRFAHALST